MAIPKNDALLVPYANNWNERIGPSPLTFALTQVQADALGEISAPYLAAVAMLDAQRGAGMRSKSQTLARDATRDAMLVTLRELYGIVQSSNAVSDADKTLLGVTPRSDTRRPTPPITVRPMTTIVGNTARTVKVGVFDPTSKSKRAKAPFAVSALVYSYVGETYPSDPTLWQLCGVATQYAFETTFADAVPSGATVWIMAAWLGSKGDTSPTSLPVSVTLQGGGANAQQSTLRLAA